MKLIAWFSAIMCPFCGEKWWKCKCK